MRLGFGGFEALHGKPERATTAGGVVFDSADPLSGLVSLVCGEDEFAYCQFSPSGSGIADRFYYARARFRFNSLPVTSEVTILAYKQAGFFVPGRSVNLTPAGKLKLSGSGTVSDVTLVTGQEYIIEFSTRRNTTLNRMDQELRVDGVSQLSNTDVSSIRNPDRVDFGFAGLTADGAEVVLDDWAVNDDTGATQNSWPGVDRRVAMLFPTGDAARDAGWVRWGGSTTDLWEAVNNRPPVSTANGDSRIVNEVATAVEEYEASFPAWSTVLPAGATPRLMAATANFSRDFTAVDMGIGLALAPDGLTFGTEKTSSINNNPGTYPTNWGDMLTDAVDASAIDTADTPHVKVRKGTANVADLVVNHLGILVEYEEGVAPPAPLEQKARVGGAWVTAGRKIKTSAGWRET